MTDFVRLLKQYDLKATFQRMTILAAIAKHGHMDVDEIYAQVRESHPTLSLATVYKNIITMVERGVLVEVPIVGRKSKYEIKKHEHAHLICRRCGNVVDQKIDAAWAEEGKSIAQKNAFTLQDIQINLYGLCDRCQQAAAS